MTCSLDGNGNSSLVFGAVTGLPPRADAAVFHDESLQKVSILIIDF